MFPPPCRANRDGGGGGRSKCRAQSGNRVAGWIRVNARGALVKVVLLKNQPKEGVLSVIGIFAN